MEELMMQFMTSGKEIPFSILFVAMLIWTQKENKERERQYQLAISSLTDSLKDMNAIKETVQDIEYKIGGL